MVDSDHGDREALLVRGGHLFTNDKNKREIACGDILIRDGRIAEIWPVERPTAELSRDLAECPVLDARGTIVIPGLINAHMHSNESFEQGAYDNVTLETWLVRSYPPLNSVALTAREQYLRTMLCAIQSLRSGVTTIQDDFLDDRGDGEAFDAAASAYRDVGLRAVLTTSFLDTSFLDGRPFLRSLVPNSLAADLDSHPPRNWREQIALYERNRCKWHDGSGLMSVVLGPISPQRCTEPLLRAIAAISEADDVPVHCHVDETRTQALTGRLFFARSLVDYLASVGLLNERVTLNHAIWLTARDAATMGEHRVSITHNPLSNLKLGSGICPVPELIAAGVNVALGTDGTTTSDTADLIEALRIASSLHKRPNIDVSRWLGAHDAFAMATTGGARSTGLGERVGAIEVGRRADIVLLDMRHPGFVPLHDPIRQLAFSVTSEAVRTVIVDGRIVLKDRKLTLVDEDSLMEEICAAAEAFRATHWPAMQRSAAQVLPYIEEMQRLARQTEVGEQFINFRDQTAPAMRQSRASDPTEADF